MFTLPLGGGAAPTVSPRSPTGGSDCRTSTARRAGILIHGDPDDPATKPDKQAVRDVTRIFADGRTVSIGLVYNGQPKWKQSFDRHVLSLDQLAAIVTDAGALRHFPRRR